MNKWKRILAISLVLVLGLLFVAVVAALALPAEPAAPVATSLDWQVIGSGGTTMSSASYTLQSTAGQAVAGPSSSANYSLLSGFWQSFQAAIREIFLPVSIG